MEENYGRYVDEDGLPNWKLPSRDEDPELWKSLVVDAIEELYPDYGGKWLASRLGFDRKNYWKLMAWAECFGIRVKKEALSRIHKECVRVYKRKTPRLTSGARDMRHRLANDQGYLYGVPPVMYYAVGTARRLTRRKPVGGRVFLLEEEITEKYGIVFLPFPRREGKR